EHENLAALSLQARLQQELSRLGQRHEEACDFGMRDRDWAAARDLLLKPGNHAAGAAEDIAEAHQHELRAVALQTLANDFGETLAGAHHRRRIDGLVGRYEHE